MKDLIRASDITEAMTTIKVLNDKIIQQQQIVNEWQITFDVDVNIKDDGLFELVITGTKGNGQGSILVLSQQEIEYYILDKDSLRKFITEEFLNKLLFETVDNAITEKFNLGIMNIKKLMNKAGKF